MKKETYGLVAAVSTLLWIGAGLAGFVGVVPDGAAAALIILAFPVSAVTTMLWWMAGKGEGDIPFMGY